MCRITICCANLLSSCVRGCTKSDSRLHKRHIIIKPGICAASECRNRRTGATYGGDNNARDAAQVFFGGPGINARVGLPVAIFKVPPAVVSACVGLSVIHLKHHN